MVGPGFSLKRKAHVKRLYDSDEQGNVLDQNVFIDVMRIDQFPVSYRGFPMSETHQDCLLVFQWLDGYNGTGDNENNNPRRIQDFRKLTNPDDSTQTMHVWISDVMVMSERAGGPGVKQVSSTSGVSHLHRYWFADNVPIVGDPGQQPQKPPGMVRQGAPLKIVNNDLGDLDMTKPVDWDSAYLPALRNGQKDSSQKLYVELTLNWTMNFGADIDTGGMRQAMSTVLTLNKANPNQPSPFDLFESAGAIYGGFANQPGNDAAPPGTGMSDDGNPIVRTDPLQTIVNVSWGGLAVEFYPKAT